MSRDFIRKVAFGLGLEEELPNDPLLWSQKQFDKIPNLIWGHPLPSLEDQRKRYGQWVYGDRKVLRNKFKNDRLKYESEKDQLRKTTGEKFFETFELSVRHTSALATDSPVFERMWQFWGNFFAISEKDFLASFSTGVYQREIIRPNMNKTFEDLVYNVTTSWCMLHHLDNAENIGPSSKRGISINSDPQEKSKVGLNENHARELLELHTVSPEANYTQEDVIEMAKVMTGWKYLWNKKYLEAGPIKFQDEYHENGPYKILGKIYDIRDYNTVSQGKELKVVIKDLANHPSTKKHIALKLCQHFICDEPNEEMMNKIIKAWNQSDGSLIDIHKATMKVAFEYGNNFKKFSMPELWLLQNSKMLDLKYYLYSYPKGFEFSGSVPRTKQLLVKRILEQLGHPIYRAKQPNGYVDLEDEWLSPELIIRRLAVARRFPEMSNSKLIYDNDFFENVIISNFDEPSNLLNLMKTPTTYSDRFVLFANSPEVMRS